MVVFDKASHSYTNEEGEKYLSVTQLLAKEYPFEAVGVIKELLKKGRGYWYDFAEEKVKWMKGVKDSEEIEKAKEYCVELEWNRIRDIGTELHQAIETVITTGDIGEAHSVACERFMGGKWGKLSCEQIVWNDELKIAGTVDLIEELPSRIRVWDHKTSRSLYESKLEKYLLQMWIYVWMLNQMSGKAPFYEIGGIIWWEDYANNKGVEPQIVKGEDMWSIGEKAMGILSNRREEVKGEVVVKERPAWERFFS